MPVMKYRSRTLTGLSQLIPEIVYVMCGARGETGKLPIRGLPQVKYVGFEADPAECERLRRNAGPGFQFENAALAGQASQRTIFITREPACSSLLRPDAKVFRRFLDAGLATKIVGEATVETVSLDELLPGMGVVNVDVLDLDTQGSELEILHGAAGFLSRAVVAVKTEVELTALYEGQPLFADVDPYLRSLGFVLFDLSRSRCRRANLPANVLTRGQFVWGDALYLRDYSWFAERSGTDAALRLCLIAAHLGFHDYALEGMVLLLQGDIGTLTPEQTTTLRGTCDQYIADLQGSSRWLRLLSGLERAGLRRPIKAAGRLAAQIGELLVKDKEMTQYNWID
jgi:FkbM family methyltransferase